MRKSLGNPVYSINSVVNCLYLVTPIVSLFFVAKNKLKSITTAFLLSTNIASLKMMLLRIINEYFTDELRRRERRPGTSEHAFEILCNIISSVMLTLFYVCVDVRLYK